MTHPIHLCKQALRGLLLAFVALQAPQAAAQTDVRPYQPGVTEEGITYFLPQTRLLVVVTAEKTTYTPGEFAAYAQRYLRVKDAPQEKHDIWTLKSVSLMPYGVADRSKAYTIKLNTKSAAPLVGLAKDGRLLSVNTEADPEPELPQPSVKKDNSPQLDPNDFKTQEILAAGSTMKMAELAAAEINDLRENRSLLAKGQADFMPKDGTQLKLMMEELDKQEKGLTMLFEGSRRSETCTFIFSYTPGTQPKTDVLFRFSKYFGPVSPNDLSGEPVYLRYKPLEAPQAAQTDAKKKDVKDLRYIVPGKADVLVYNDGHSYAEGTYSFAQLGHVEHLGGDLFNKRFTTRVKLYPSTGGIQQITGEPEK